MSRVVYCLETAALSLVLTCVSVNTRLDTVPTQFDAGGAHRAEAVEPHQASPALPVSLRADHDDGRNLTEIKVAKSGFPVLGTVALKVETPWLVSKAAEAGLADRSALCNGLDQACDDWHHVVEEARGTLALERLQFVNTAVNARIGYRGDSPGPLGDHWSPAPQTIQRGQGDCEDLAILKLRLLIEAGVAPHDLAMVVVERRAERDRHAILVARLGERLIVLDSIRHEIADDVHFPEYRPIYSLNAHGSWVHGFPPPPALSERATTPLVLAYAGSVTKKP